MAKQRPSSTPEINWNVASFRAACAEWKVKGVAERVLLLSTLDAAAVEELQRRRVVERVERVRKDADGRRDARGLVRVEIDTTQRRLAGWLDCAPSALDRALARLEALGLAARGRSSTGTRIELRVSELFEPPPPPRPTGASLPKEAPEDGADAARLPASQQVGAHSEKVGAHSEKVGAHSEKVGAHLENTEDFDGGRPPRAPTHVRTCFKEKSLRHVHVRGEGRPPDAGGRERQPSGWREASDAASLSNPRDCQRLWRIVVAAGWLAESEQGRLRFFAACACCRRAERPKAALTSLVKRRRWELLTNEDDDWAREAIRSIDFPARPSDVEDNVRRMGESLRLPEVEDDTARLKAAALRRMAESPMFREYLEGGQ
ncbi:MAG: hypothetical protein KY476_00540 [Planctomycetes bacterium]|nr:hypothetical protein [Planctomycetota bacterium]